MSYKNILVEGPDRSGKSTLVSLLSDTLGLDSIKLRHQDGNQFERYKSFYTTANRAVFDRGHISEDLYCPIYGRSASFTAKELKQLDAMINKDTLVIFCLPDPTVAMKRLQVQIKANEEAIHPRDWKRSYQAFQHVLSRFPHHLIHRSGSWIDLVELVNRVGTDFGPKPPLYPPS